MTNMNLQQDNNDDLKFYLEININSITINRFGIKIRGWAMGYSEIYKLIYYCEDNTFEIPVGLPNPEASQIINSNNLYPFRNSFFSGISYEKEVLIDSKDMMRGLDHSLDFVDDNKKIMKNISFALIPSNKIVLSS